MDDAVAARACLAHQASIMTTGISLETAKEYLQQLNLNYLIDAMCSPNYTLPRWTKEDAEKACQLYKNFLFLQKKYLPQPLVPTREIDEVWHNHILHTKRYHEDCMKIFGHYLHHLPASPNDDNKKLIEYFLQTKQLYLETFKAPLVTFR